MATVYKVHPAIGVGRVGSSADAGFLQGEHIDAPPFELDAGGQEIAFQGYKDAAFRIRRQGARFRVFEYERQDGDADRLVREITPDLARIEWSVELAAAKAAGPLMVTGEGEGLGGENVIRIGPGFRNAPPPGHTRDDLIARARVTVSGPGASQVAEGEILGRPLILGEARTDAEGRLVVLPAFGRSESWADPPEPLGSYLNNETWFDDIADGPVDARLRFRDAAGAELAPVAVDEGAWFVAAPPDFAPDVLPVVNLEDIAVDAWARARGLPAPTAINFADDIAPVLKAAASIAGSNELVAEWATIRDLVLAGGLDNPAEDADQLRADVVQFLKDGIAALHGSFPAWRLAMLDLYAAGEFTPGPDPARALSAAVELDRAVLRRCIGAGFYPGIEAGFTMTLTGLWHEPGRLTRNAFADHDGVQRKLEAGMLSQRMACPWQADFYDCEETWWPAQRPDIFRAAPDGSPLTPPGAWPRGIAEDGYSYPERRALMVAHFAQLGVVLHQVKDGVPVSVEVGRDPAF